MLSLTLLSSIPDDLVKVVALYTVVIDDLRSFRIIGVLSEQAFQQEYFNRCNEYTKTSLGGLFNKQYDYSVIYWYVNQLVAGPFREVFDDLVFSLVFSYKHKSVLEYFGRT